MMTLPKSLNDEIWEYCRVNSITNIDEFIVKLVKQGFTVEKFGATPKPNEKIIEKIVEKIVEVPIPMVETELSETLKDKIKIIEELHKQISDLTFNNAELNKMLIEERKKKKDLYGE